MARKGGEENAGRDRGVPQRPGGQLGGRGTRRKNSSEARGDKQQRAEPHPDPEAAGLNPVWLREEAPFNASTTGHTPPNDEDGVSRGVARLTNRPSQKANRPDRSC
jgi:hypothetical protein